MRVPILVGCLVFLAAVGALWLMTTPADSLPPQGAGVSEAAAVSSAPDQDRSAFARVKLSEILDDLWLQNFSGSFNPELIDLPRLKRIEDRLWTWKTNNQGVDADAEALADAAWNVAYSTEKYASTNDPSWGEVVNQYVARFNRALKRVQCSEWGYPRIPGSTC